MADARIMGAKKLIPFSILLAVVITMLFIIGVVAAWRNATTPADEPSPNPIPTTGGNCGTGCAAGYVCLQECGPPVVREGDPEPGYYCERVEIAAQPRNCPICLASNTMIDTPTGQVNVQNIVVGSDVWSINGRGERVVSSVIAVGSMTAPTNHKVVHLVLSDDREVWLSPNHPDAHGRPISRLSVGDAYDGAHVVSADVVPYWSHKTYDLLPAGETGLYFANGILVHSTLSH